ncbi:MAG: sugar phosphate isomerase/epimerase [Gemmatimonadetes bacterium]|nr:sugar phosphate isomerase/epimerase [Gemmatimonadota bacterium]NNM06396.1 sugar phosphate isomerase/epimerase [Gemmatimonadota bacterium]
MESRRRFLKTTVAASAGLALPLSGCGPEAEGSTQGEAAPQNGPAGSSTGTIELGVASYSLRELSRAEAIAAVQALQTPYVCIKSMHLPYESGPQELATGRAEFEAAGLTIVGGGVVTLQQDDDDDIRRYFEYAKASGMPLMVIAPSAATLPRIERFVMEYDIAVAIHNHGPTDVHFPGPGDALPIIQDMDPRVGVCVDLGHTTRTGVDIVEAIAEAGDRVLDIHAKDLKDLLVAESQCIVGEGAMPFPEIFQHLVAMDYSGYVNLEYEIDAQNPLPGMLQSFSYMRGVLAGLGIAEGQ